MSSAAILTGSRTGLVRNANLHWRAGVLLIFLALGIRVAAQFEQGSVMLVPALLIVAWASRLSPPATAVFFLFGWALLLKMDVATSGGVRLPAISLMTLSVMVCMSYERAKNKTLDLLLSRYVLNRLALLLGFFAIGTLMAYFTGCFASPAIRHYNWDVFRSWWAYFLMGFLACRSGEDLKVILLGLPVAFFIYPLVLPTEAWLEFVTFNWSGVGVMGMGLGAEALNTNTLGQGAALATVAAVAGAFTWRKRAARGWLLVLAAAALGVVFASGSRQALLGVLVGTATIAVVRDYQKSILYLVFFMLVAYLAMLGLFFILPEGSGLRDRYLELGESSDTWQTGSSSARMDDFSEALQKWQGAPLLGHGFGGQNSEEVLSFGNTEMEESGWLLRGTHNVILGVLGQTGIAGLCLFGAFLMLTFRDFLGFLRAAPAAVFLTARFLRTSVFGILAAFFLMQNISGGFGLAAAPLALLSGAILGVVAAERATQRARKAPFVLASSRRADPAP